MQIGPGHLVLVVGPSGAGKDSVIGRAREMLGAAPRIHFPTRVITRQPDATEVSTFVDAEAFDALEALGGFVLTWRAHGLAYGLPVALDEAIKSGDTVVANVSRAVVAAARARYRNCAVVLITASDEIRAQRLATRRRESAVSLAERFAREARIDSTVVADLVIRNEGELDAAAHEFFALLTRVTAPADQPA